MGSIPAGNGLGILRVTDSGFVVVARRPSASFPPGNDHLSKNHSEYCRIYYKCLLFFTTQCLLYLQAAILQANVRSSKLACLVLFFRDMKSSLTLLLVLTAATAFFVVQPVKASHVVQGGPTYVTVPDAGSTMSLLGFALLGVAALRRKLSR